MTVNDIVNDIRQRNVLRKNAGLPILDVTDEIARRLGAERTRAFEEKFARGRPQFVDVWSDKNESWLSRAAQWSSARADFRIRFDLGELKDANGA